MKKLVNSTLSSTEFLISYGVAGLALQIYAWFQLTELMLYSMGIVFTILLGIVAFNKEYFERMFFRFNQLAFQLTPNKPNPEIMQKMKEFSVDVIQEVYSKHTGFSIVSIIGISLNWYLYIITFLLAKIKIWSTTATI